MRKRGSQRRVIDVRGLRSPQPVLVLADEVERIGPGETIAVLSDDPDSKADIFHWCEASQMDIVELQYLPGADRFVFRRPAVAMDPHAHLPSHVPLEWGHAA